MAVNKNRFAEITASLSPGDLALVNRLHEQALALGCTTKISSTEKSPASRKCEYLLNKKTQLYILQITDNTWSIRCKFYNMAKYPEALEQCASHTKETLLRNAKNCGSRGCSHGGGCKGPVEFTLGGKTWQKCRHSLLFDQITAADVEDLEKLLRCESAFSAIP